MKNTRRGLVFYIIAKTFGITLLFLKKGMLMRLGAGVLKK